MQTLEQAPGNTLRVEGQVSDRAETEVRMLVLGLGNDILTDDAIGLFVVRRLQQDFADHPEIKILETPEMGLALLDHLAGYPLAIIVDSIQTGNSPPGTVHELDADSLVQLTGRTPHFVGLGEAIALGRCLGVEMPRAVKVFAVEVVDPFTLGARLSPALEQAFPAILEQVRRGVQQFSSSPGLMPTR